MDDGQIALEKKLAACETKLANAENEIKELRTRLNNRRSAIRALKERAESTESQLAGLRKRLHWVEGHNQIFERCESPWCHPSEEYNPALMFEPPNTNRNYELLKRAEAAEAALAAMGKNRNMFCHSINLIAQVLGMSGKDHFSPDAVLRMAENKMNELASLRERVEGAVEAFEEVLRISDRKHDAWDKARSAIAILKEGESDG